MSEITDKEIIIMMTTKCADLERQLAEAMSLLESVESFLPEDYKEQLKGQS